MSVLTSIAEEIVSLFEIDYITYIVSVLTLIAEEIVSLFVIDNLLTLCPC